MAPWSSELREVRLQILVLCSHFGDGFLKVRREHVSKVVYPPQSLVIGLTTEVLTRDQSILDLSVKETTSVVY